jgi:hypothetical protein
LQIAFASRESAVACAEIDSFAYETSPPLIDKFPDLRNDIIRRIHLTAV